jgi:Flp pilus assembly CpaE family ATPase
MLSDSAYAAAAAALGRRVAEEAENSPAVEELERMASCRCRTAELAA